MNYIKINFIFNATLKQIFSKNTSNTFGENYMNMSRVAYPKTTVYKKLEKSMRKSMTILEEDREIGLALWHSSAIENFFFLKKKNVINSCC